MKYVIFFATQNIEGAVFELLDSNADLFYKHRITSVEPDTLTGIRGFLEHDYIRACVMMMEKEVVGVRI